MLISVIIPTCLRDEEQLKRAINSALFNGLDINLINIIVINDNSSIKISSQSALLNTYQAYKQVIFVDNSGTSRAAGARNFGVYLAKTELITFVDDDDFILPGRLSLMLSEFKEQSKKNKVALISTGRFYEYDNFMSFQAVKRQKLGQLKLKDIYVHNEIDIGFLVKKEDFEALGGFDTSFTNLEDWDFIIRLLAEKGDAYKIPNNLYVVKNDTRSNRVSNNDHIGLAQLINKHRDVFGEEWAIKLEAQALLSQKKLNVLSCIKLSNKIKSTYILKLYVKTLIKKFYVL